MADFGAVQSAEAIAGLIILTKKIIDYCKKLRRAEKDAMRLRQSIQSFQDVMQGPRILLGSYSSPRLDRVGQNERILFQRHIKVAVDGCQSTLDSIVGILERLFRPSATPLKKLNDSITFVGQARVIRDHLRQLDDQKMALLIAFAVLGLYDQHTSSPPERNTEIFVEQLIININVGREWFRSSLNRSRPPDTTWPGLLSSEAYVVDDHRRTLQDLQSVGLLAEQVLNAARAPSDSRRDSFAVQALLTEDTNAASRAAFTSTPQTPSVIDETGIDDAEDDLLHVGIASGQKIHLSDDPSKLKRFIGKVLERSQQSTRVSDFTSAIQYLEKAIAYSMQLERLPNGSPFDNRVDLLEQLADACKRVCNWTAATRILELLLGPDKLPHPDADFSVNGPVVRYARHCELLASIIVDKYCMISSESEGVLEDALTRAEHARFWLDKVKETRALTPPERRHWSDCTKSLEQIRTIYGDVEEASCFAEDLKEDELIHSSANTGLQSPGVDSLLTSRPRSVVSISTDASQNRLRHYEAAKTAVKMSRPFTLDQLFRSPNAPFFVDERLPDGLTILQIAAGQGASAMVQELLRFGADINIQDDMQETALVKAIRHDHHETVEALLQWHGGAPDLGFRFPDGKSLLHYSVQHRALRSLEKLLRYKGDLVDLKDRTGQTLLHHCAEEGDAETARILLSFKASLNQEDKTNRKPGDYTVRSSYSRHQQVFQLFMEHSAKGNVGASEQTLLDNVLNRSSLTAREQLTLSSYLSIFRKRAQTRSASDGAIRNQSIEEDLAAKRSKTHDGASRPKRWYSGRLSI